MDLRISCCSLNSPAQNAHRIVGVQIFGIDEDDCRGFREDVQRSLLLVVNPGLSNATYDLLQEA